MATNIQFRLFLIINWIFRSGELINTLVDSGEVTTVSDKTFVPFIKLLNLDFFEHNLLPSHNVSRLFQESPKL
jgi:hypothetical protein